MVIKTMGKSVKMGASAILHPSPTPYRKDCEITKVVKGPGVNPPLKPKIIPDKRNESSAGNFNSLGI